MLSILKNSSVPLRLRKKIRKLVSKPVSGQEFSAPMFEHVYYGKTGNHQDDKIFTYGMHEPATIRLMRSVLSFQKEKGIVPVYADIGTNMGQHLIAVSGRATKAFGFEPWDVVRNVAAMQIQNNNAGHVTVFPFGLSDQDAFLPYTRPQNDNLGTGMFGEGGADTLEVRQGDTVFTGMENLPTVMKIDTEGFEDKVLRGLAKTISQSRPAIVFEYSAETRRIMADEAAIKGLLGPDYSLYGILPSREYPVLVPFKEGKKYENIVAWPYFEPVSVLQKHLD
jgi:FkbM family methyltransferase